MTCAAVCNGKSKPAAFEYSGIITRRLKAFNVNRNVFKVPGFCCLSNPSGQDVSGALPCCNLFEQSGYAIDISIIDMKI